MSLLNIVANQVNFLHIFFLVAQAAGPAVAARNLFEYCASLNGHGLHKENADASAFEGCAALCS